MAGNTYKQETGRRGEDLASSFFIDKGFNIIEKNFRSGHMGEIDLIVRKENLIVFVEVKSRNTDRYGGALYSINKRKQMTIKKIAKIFINSNPSFDTKDFTYRFDLISVIKGKIEWQQDIFR